MPALSDWFSVSFDERSIHWDVTPPEQEAWKQTVEFERIIRVCIKTADFLASDEVYIFSDERAESYVIPTGANGGLDVWNELIRRELFSAELAIEAATADDQLFCWPMPE